MPDREAALEWRGALLGAMISGVFGLGWTQWGTSGLTGPMSTAIRVAGIVIGLVIVVWCARLLGTVPRAGASASRASSDTRPRRRFALASFLLVVAFEVVAIGGGNALLGATAHGDYRLPWAAIVVGLHFLAFGRLFFTGAYWLGAALIAAGILGTSVGLSGGGLAAIAAAAGLPAAMSLFVASGWTIVGARRSAHA